MKALVAGAAGLIGSHIVRTLVDHGHEVTALLRPASNRAGLCGLPVNVLLADLLDDELEPACAGHHVVFHAAAHFVYSGISRAALYDTAVKGTERLLLACARSGVPRVVLTSSSVVFGYSRNGVSIDETAAMPSDNAEPAYVAAKIAQHKCAQLLARQFALDVRFACPTMTLGPGGARLGPSNGLIVSYLTDPLRCTFPGGCNLVAVRDVADGHLLIAEHGEAGESYLLGSENLSWRQVHTMIAELAGVAPPRLELNHSLAYLAATADELRSAIAGHTALSTREQAGMLGRYYWYSHAKAAAVGYQPVPARDALIAAISWLAGSPHVSRETRTQMHLSHDVYRFRAAQGVAR